MVFVGIWTTLAYLVEVIKDKYDEFTSDRYYVSQHLGNDYEVHSYYGGLDRIVRRGWRNRLVVKEIERVDGDVADSLWLVRKEGKYAYFNSQTGRMTSPFIYKNAWCYSEGMAAVVDENNQLQFVDPRGYRIIESVFQYNNHRCIDYRFHNQRCPMVDSVGKVGLINRSGEWVLMPQYDSAVFVNMSQGGYWTLMRNDSLMVLDSTGHQIVPLTRGHELRIVDDVNLEVWHKWLPGRLYDATGNVLANQTYFSVNEITYIDNGEEISTKVLAYYTDSYHCGLMSSSGQILTEAKYDGIDAIGQTLFKAKCGVECDDKDYEYYNECCPSMYILLNEKGELVECGNGFVNN